jgi:hypothetical protein
MRDANKKISMSEVTRLQHHHTSQGNLSVRHHFDFAMCATEVAMSYYRTAEHRKLRAELIRKWKPWEKSTGPKSAKGKARSAQNAYKGATREVLRELRRALRQQDEAWHAIRE